MPTKRAPSGKKKLVTLHVDGADVTPGYVAFMAKVLSASARRERRGNGTPEPGDPVMQTNSAGDLVVYVNQWTV